MVTQVIAALKCWSDTLFTICLVFDILKLTLGLEAGDISPVLDIDALSFNSVLYCAGGRICPEWVFHSMLSFG